MMNFKDMTYENMMADMMADMPNGISTKEGSLLYNACAKQALKLEEAYIAADELQKNSSVLTMDEERLIEYGRERAVHRKQATVSTVKGEFLQEVKIGTRFTLKEETFVITKKITDFTYELECENTGIVGNIVGELELIDFIQDFQGGKVTEILIPGQEKEEIEKIREKIINSFESRSFAGNRAAYKEFINAIDGVGGCRLPRRKKNDLFIRPCIIASDFSSPSDSLILKVQEQVDPDSSGEGDGTAPINHKVCVEGVKEVTIDIEVHELKIEQGYDLNEIKVAIENKIDNYFTTLKKEWENKKELVIKTFQIAADIIEIHGVNDISGITLNKKEENVILENEIPKRGEVVV